MFGLSGCVIAIVALVVVIAILAYFLIATLHLLGVRTEQINAITAKAEENERRRLNKDKERADDS